jgi:hypothetical protein
MAKNLASVALEDQSEDSRVIIYDGNIFSKQATGYTASGQEA